MVVSRHSSSLMNYCDLANDMMSLTVQYGWQGCRFSPSHLLGQGNLEESALFTFINSKGQQRPTMILHRICYSKR